MAKEGGKAMVRLPSGELRYVRLDCKATIGVVGNSDHSNVKIWVRLVVRVIMGYPPDRSWFCNEPV